MARQAKLKGYKLTSENTEVIGFVGNVKVEYSEVPIIDRIKFLFGLSFKSGIIILRPLEGSTGKMYARGLKGVSLEQERKGTANTTRASSKTRK